MSRMSKKEMIAANKIETTLGAIIDPPLGYTVESWFQHCERMFDEADAEEKEKENGTEEL